MKLLLTGATGYVGQFILTEAHAAGDEVMILTRTAPQSGIADHFPRFPFDLSDPPHELPTADALIHAAFDHQPGKYRGGEGDDPQGFLQRNLDGSKRLFAAAANSGVRRIVFLSSRAVYGDYPPGTLLTEDLPPCPDTLYGKMKWQVEQVLSEMAGPDLCTVSLRATGVYGRATRQSAHKWKDLFSDFESCLALAPRRATEVHGADLAQAVRLCLTTDPERISGKSFNVSDLVLDRAELLKLYAEATGIAAPLPRPAEGLGSNVMDCAALQALGWQPRGKPGLEAFLADLADAP